MSGKKHSNEHHLLARSRGGPSESWNLIKKTIKEHRCFHILFINFLPCEIIEKIKQWTRTKSGEVDKRKLLKKRGKKYIKIKCWETLFGRDICREKAIKIIKENWSVRNQKNFRGCFRYKECFSSYFKKKCPIIEMYKKEKQNERIHY